MPRIVRETLLSVRDLMATMGPFLLIAIAALVAVYVLLDPAPPKHVVLATGPEGSAYEAFGKRYAAELKRYDVLLRFVPNQWRAEMTEAKVREQFEGEKKDDVAQMIRLITANLDNPIEQEGDKAHMTYGDRYDVKFIREDGVWKIKDPD